MAPERGKRDSPTADKKQKTLGHMLTALRRSSRRLPSDAAQVEAEWCRISHHVHSIEFRQIVRDAEIAYAISPVVRRHRLSAEETEKFLLELRIPRAANVAQITHRLVVNCSQKASSELAAQS